MWVRNQSKDKLFNVNSFEIAKFIKDGNYRYDVSERQFSNNDYYIYSQDAGILGAYKSKKRALEILDEVQLLLAPKLIIRFNKFGEQELHEKCTANIVYAMPQK